MCSFLVGSKSERDQESYLLQVTEHQACASGGSGGGGLRLARLEAVTCAGIDRENVAFLAEADARPGLISTTQTPD